MANATWRQILFFCFLPSLFLSSSSQCSNDAFPRNRIFRSCTSLPHLNANLHWNYSPASGTAEIAYRAALSSTGWVSWAINPNRTGMVGSQALVAVQYSNGSVAAYTTSVNSYRPSMQPAPLSFDVPTITAEHANGEMIIYATIALANISTSVNQVWQAGSVSGDRLLAHQFSGANLQSMGSVDFLSGQAGTTGGGSSKIRRRNIHGVMAAVSWGTLMPLGAIVARYVKVSKSAGPLWFYLHLACQTSAYAIGVAAWGMGLKLGSESVGITHHVHRRIGIIVFCYGTLQAFALLLRPKPDHKYRIVWNIYHHSVGYSTIILSVINVFKGLEILHPEKKWKHACIGIIVSLGAIAVSLEAITWPIVLKRRSSSASKSHEGVNGTNGPPQSV